MPLRNGSTLCLILIALALVSCAKPQLVYDLGSRSQADFDRDNWTCQRDSQTWGGGSGIAGALAASQAQRDADRLYQTCMKGHGWRLIEPAKN
jgi:hypothetical protein